MCFAMVITNAQTPDLSLSLSLFLCAFSLGEYAFCLSSLIVMLEITKADFLTYLIFIFE